MKNGGLTWIVDIQATIQIVRNSRVIGLSKEGFLAALQSDRDEDLEGPVGFDSRAQRKREFAADMGLQAHVLRMAAEGAVSAYEDITGETWKPYERTVEQPGASVDRQAATAQIAAFE